MKYFQKIAVGLLGLTHPEMFVPRWKPAATRAAEPGAVQARKLDCGQRVTGRLASAGPRS
jgi:hypothetical protein